MSGDHEELKSKMIELDDRVVNLDDRVINLENSMGRIEGHLESINKSHMETNELLRDQLSWTQGLYEGEVQSDRELRKKKVDKKSAAMSKVWEEVKGPLKYLLLAFIAYFSIYILQVPLPFDMDQVEQPHAPPRVESRDVDGSGQ